MINFYVLCILLQLQKLRIDQNVRFYGNSQKKHIPSTSGPDLHVINQLVLKIPKTSAMKRVVLFTSVGFPEIRKKGGETNL